MPSNTVRLEDMCSVIRSKNAGPYLITLDMIFKDRDAYESVAKEHLITRELIAERYRMPLDAVPVPVGSRQILFSHPEFGEKRAVLTVGVSPPIDLHMDMTR